MAQHFELCYLFILQGRFPFNPGRARHCLRVQSACHAENTFSKPEYKKRTGTTREEGGFKEISTGI